MGFKFGTKSLENMVGVHSDLIRVAKRALDLSKTDFGVAAKAVRTAEEQNKLYQIGRTTGTKGKTVTDKDGYKSKSNHQVTGDGTGHSLDLTAWVDGAWEQNKWEPYYFDIAWAMAQAAREYGVRIRWGGNWYECLNDYGTSLAAVKKAVERYKEAHPGPDFIDGPHFELLAA